MSQDSSTSGGEEMHQHTWGDRIMECFGTQPHLLPWARTPPKAQPAQIPSSESGAEGLVKEGANPGDSQQFNPVSCSQVFLRLPRLRFQTFSRCFAQGLLKPILVLPLSQLPQAKFQPFPPLWESFSHVLTLCPSLPSMEQPIPTVISAVHSRPKPRKCFDPSDPGSGEGRKGFNLSPSPSFCQHPAELTAVCPGLRARGAKRRWPWESPGRAGDCSHQDPAQVQLRGPRGMFVGEWDEHGPKAPGKLFLLNSSPHPRDEG